MLKNTKIGKHVIPKFLLGITLSVLTILILRSGYMRATSNASASENLSSSRRDRDCDREPTGVENLKYFINFKVDGKLMPGELFDGEDAYLHVNRVRPVYKRGKCRGVPNRAIVLIHGRTIPGPVSFDTRYPSAEDGDKGKLSLQESLAEAGIDTFAPSLLGYGLSTRFSNGLDHPCNASLPPYKKDDKGNETCDVAEGCDRSSNELIFPLNQQITLLKDNPLDGRQCEHLSKHRFANTDVWARDVIRVIDDAIERAQPDNGKVVLVGNSLGGVTVARALSILGENADNKVQRVVFFSSLFDRLFQAGVEIDDTMPFKEPNDADFSTTFPMALFNSNIVRPSQQDPSRIIPHLENDLWIQLMANDLVGRNWGVNNPNTKPGLLRAPTFSRYGWRSEAANNFTIPTLVLHGLDDTISPPSNSERIYNALTRVTNKVLVQVQRSGHAMLWEGCVNDPRCNDENPKTKPYGGGDSEVWAGPYSTVAAALIEWVKHGTFNRASSGRFVINGSGVASN
jgi:pimeloyl-ACP methyl ester carboxylesterase